MTLDQWWIFVVVWIAASIPLGPNALNCIALSASAGFRRSLWAVAGLLVAALCHMAVTVLGVAAILLANAMLFQVLKLCGAAYLIWMGISMWRKRNGLPAPDRPVSLSRLHIVRRAFLISMSNPKSILAYLAVFPQFISLNAPLPERLVVLVPTALTVVVIVYMGYCAAGLGVGRLLRSARRRLAFNRTVGGFYIFAGAGLAVSDLPSGRS